MNELQDNTSYKSWTDTHNVIKEYYKLKQMLCLTEEERFNLKHHKAYTEVNAEDVISRLWEYIDRVKPEMYDLTNWLQIHRITLLNVLYGNKTPSAEVLDKILNFLESVA